MTLWRALRRFLKADGMIYSGYLAFLSMLALLPVLGVLFWLSQQSSIIEAAEGAFRDFLFTNLFPSTAKQVVAVVDNLRANARGLGQTGVAIIVGDMLLKALALSAAVDRIWGAERRKFWGYVRGATVMLLLMPAVVAAIVWTIQFLQRFFVALLPAWRIGIEHVFDPIETSLPLVVALTLIYRWVPARVTAWRSPFAAALLVAILVEVSRYLIAHYIAQMQQLKSLYGAFIAFPVLLMSIFVIWALVLYGAALVAEGFGERGRFSPDTKARTQTRQGRKA